MWNNNSSKETNTETIFQKNGEDSCSILGPTVKFSGGELSADEHLIIQGVVEGTVELKNHNLTIGESGRIQADIKAVVITVEGNLVGDMQGGEIVIIKRTATVKGNARAPRISVEEGANFDGSVDTNEKQHPESVTEIDTARQA